MSWEILSVASSAACEARAMEDGGTFTHVMQVEGVATPKGYSHAVITTRAVLVTISGQVALDASGAFVGVDDFDAQVDQAFANLVAVLAAAGCSPADVVKLTHFIVGLDASRLASVRSVRDRIFPGAKPSSSLLGVSALFAPQALYEVEAIAARSV